MLPVVATCSIPLAIAVIERQLDTHFPAVVAGCLKHVGAPARVTQFNDGQAVVASFLAAFGVSLKQRTVYFHERG
jgi:hypothetical protein